MNDELKADLRLVAIVAGGTALFSRTELWGLFSWALSAPFHEMGHTVAAWLVSRPAIPSPFRAIIFSEDREIWFLGLQLAGCWVLHQRGRADDSPLLIGLSRTWAALLLACSLLLGHDAREQFIAWAGQGGELVLAAAAIAFALAYGSELPWVYGASSHAAQHRVLLFWGAVVYAASASRWVLALGNPNFIPFGGFGSEEGDMDVLKLDYYWTLSGIVRSYLLAALLSAAGVGLVAMLHWEGRSRA